MVAVTVTVNPRREKALQTKAAPDTRRGPTICTQPHRSLEVQRNRTAGRIHADVISIDPRPIVANANSQISEKLFTAVFSLLTEHSLRKLNTMESRCPLELVSMGISLGIRSY